MDCFTSFENMSILPKTIVKIVSQNLCNWHPIVRSEDFANGAMLQGENWRKTGEEGGGLSAWQQGRCGRSSLLPGLFISLFGLGIYKNLIVWTGNFNPHSIVWSGNLPSHALG